MQYVMIIEVLLVCVISSITDIKNGKIYNKVLLPAFAIGAVSAIVYYINSQNVNAYFINLIIGGACSFALYMNKIWGAGDSKLWIYICSFIPFALYDYNPYILYPSMYIFIYTFISAYIYVIIDTVIQYANKKGRKPIAVRIANIRKEQILVFLSVYFIITVLYGAMNLILNQYFLYNRLWISIFVILLISSKINRFTDYFKSIYCVMLGAIFIITIILQLIWSGINNFDITPIIVWIVIVLVRLLSSDFNYDEIQTKDVKKGLVLSRITISTFHKSKVKGLPLYTDETTKYRISEEEAEAIRRWQHSKRGNDTIIIVRHIPFAIFFTFGIIIFLILNMGLLNG
jgi:preflagellin peptidase FlaK